ncbi:TIGR03617 family F420-dependent LLM class oxidoreductase [Streptomyces gilvus]|uniref:TIGR03617 family F420-dependent LLM class oxidoreductase n=1 Tax=Streptomyces gilvus TaxID=2920937 RepID=UPI001F0CDF09|nr:TIGR03617 family F420-dependent LLM class oxidoreductase [Streptomyces sp. CME 23]MCH5677560.1 TIGR03617 family F420-dependent LLM class oxidoreductase [Streptomyces sp. CME 23]
MKVDAKLSRTDKDGGARPVSDIAEQARDAENAGYHALWGGESAYDPFLPLVPAAGATTRLEVGTAVAVAFARSPMTLAYTAHDLNLLADGRLLLGLGSQVRPHVERRFGMPWSRPASRMREFVEAMRAIWSAWNEGTRLDFRGDFYQHTLMTPFFSPAPSPSGPPKVYLAGVGDRMTEVAGAVCDGFLPHPFTTERYLREHTLPILRGALQKAGRDLGGFSVSLSGMVVTGRSEEEFEAAASAMRRQIAFYGSTPAYRGVLELHGWGDLGQELANLARGDSEDRWRRMGDLVDDEVLHAFAVVAEPDRLAQAVAARFGGLVDRFSFYSPYQHDPGIWAPAVAELSKL